MDVNAIMESLASAQQDIPGEVAIFELRRSPVDEQLRRLRKWLKIGGDACEKNFDRGDWVSHDDHTLVRLPQGAQAVVYHASGAVQLFTGLGPMEQLFDEVEAKGQLIERVEAFARTLGFHDGLGRNETLAFERLWQIKASGADRSGKVIEPVLCRAIGAFRQHVEGIAVLGRASLAVQIAGGGVLDSVSMLMRSPASERYETAKVIHVDRAVRQIGQQLAARFGHAKGEIKLESRDGLRFGYLSLPKRKVQRLLAPVYMATIDVSHELERQAFTLVVPATDKAYLPLEMPGAESVSAQSSKITAKRCC